MASTPYYTHDCTNCRFIGHTFDTEDIYVCERATGDHTLLVRYGNGPAMYASSPISILARNLGAQSRYPQAGEPLGYRGDADNRIYCRACAQDDGEATWQDEAVCAICHKMLLASRQDFRWDHA